jgi:hypothetical protein
MHHAGDVKRNRETKRRNPQAAKGAGRYDTMTDAPNRFAEWGKPAPQAAAEPAPAPPAPRPRRSRRALVATLAIAAAVAAGALTVTLGGPRTRAPGHPASVARPSYPAGVQTSFLGGCERAGNAARCTCALRYFQRHVPLSTFVAYTAAVASGRAGRTPRWATDAARICVAKPPPAAPPSRLAQDGAAEQLAFAAQAAIETFAISHNDSYRAANRRPSALAALDTAIVTARHSGIAYLSAVSATADSYTVTSTSASGDAFSIARAGTGAITRSCRPALGTHGGCVDGSW